MWLDSGSVNDRGYKALSVVNSNAHIAVIERKTFHAVKFRGKLFELGFGNQVLRREIAFFLESYC